MADPTHATHFNGPVLASGNYLSDPRIARHLRNAPNRAVECLAHRRQAFDPTSFGRTTGIANPWWGGGYTPAFAVFTGGSYALQVGSNGKLNLLFNSTDNTTIELHSANCFLPEADKPISFFARTAFKVVANTEFATGISNGDNLTEWSSGAENFDDFIGFYRNATEDANTIKFGVWASGSNTNSIHTITLPFDITAGEDIDLGFTVHGVGLGSEVSVYVGKAGGKYSNQSHTIYTVSSTVLARLTAALLVNGMGINHECAAAGTDATGGVDMTVVTANQPY